MKWVQTKIDTLELTVEEWEKLSPREIELLQRMKKELNNYRRTVFVLKDILTNKST